MKIVLFLGAGFSAPFGLPTMHNFIRVAQDSPRLTADDKAFLDELILVARRANSFLQTSPTNLEDILSLSVMQDRLSLQKDDLQKTPRIIRILQSIYSDPKNLNNYWKQLKVLERFLGTVITKHPHSFSIITTNYDLLVESAFYAIQTPLSPTLPFTQYLENDRVETHGSLLQPQGIALYKLHGSVNWFLVGDELQIENRVVYIQSFESTRWLPRTCTTNYRSNHNPLIIPPSFLKPDLGSPIRTLWSSASAALSEAEQIIFIGYSFPSSDIEMKYFLASALVDNPRLRRIDIIDPNAETIAAKLKHDTSGFGNHFREMLHPIGKDWTQATLEMA